jgi:two-component system NarL family sensor kinase
MTDQLPRDRGMALAMALLRVTLVVVILLSELLVDARWLGSSYFYVVVAIAAAYSILCLAVALWPGRVPGGRVLTRLHPGFDILLLTGLAYTSGGAYSEVRKAFFVIPMAAAFTERPRSAAAWSLLAVLSLTLVSVVARGHPQGAINNWERLTVNQDLYLAWTGAAATLLAFGLRRRSAEAEDLASSRQRLVVEAMRSVERERTRLANALHDSPVQNLIAARHDLRRAERTGEAESFVRLHEALDTTIGELREEIYSLHPHVLDHVGLKAALEQVARRQAVGGGVEVRVSIDPDAQFPDQEMLFALGRELLSNAAKHAQARHIRLVLSRQGGCVNLEVADDGCGMAEGRMRQALLEGHVGLAAVGERVSALEGNLTISSSPGAGTRVRIALPQPTGLTERAPRIRWGGADVSDRVTPRDTLQVSPA